MAKTTKECSNPGESLRHILIIGSVWPEPDSSAAGTRMMTIIRLFLSKSWKISFASAAADSPYMADLGSIGVQRVPIPLNDSRLDAILEQVAPDWVLFDRFMTEEQFGWRVAAVCPHAFRILDTVDLHCLRHARRLAHQTDEDVTDADMCNDLALREVAAIYRSDLSLILSREEMDALQGPLQVPGDLLCHLPLMAPLPEPAQWPSFSDRTHFIHIGNFKHPPNWDAVQWLQQEIWPIIRQALPQADLHIYGAYAPPKATQLHKPRDGFYVKGRADNALDTMSDYRVCLAPLRFGAGQKGKLLDALLTGTPSVTTAIGAEGMSGTGPWPGTVADSASAIADAAVQLYQDADTWTTAQTAILPLLRENFDQAALTPPLLHRLETVSKNLSIHRKKNFTGAMLQHHSLKSTEYMARWIEAKNR